MFPTRRIVVAAMMTSWWVIQTEAQREHTVCALLARARYETYIPRIKHRSRIAPLFPSYVFVRVADQFYPVRWTAHVVRLLMAGDQPARLPEQIVDEIRRRESGGFVRLPSPPQLRRGQRVRVINGSFAGLLAVHQGMGSRERVWVLLNLMNQQVAVELPRKDVEPLLIVC
jgi:transcriptional antiterminator RfaH